MRLPGEADDGGAAAAARASSGEGYLVANPDLVVMMRSSIFVAAPNSDRAWTIPYLHIAAVEAGSNGNGHGKRSPRKRKR